VVRRSPCRDARGDGTAGSLNINTHNYDVRLEKALAPPLRARILDVLEEGEASPRELSVALGAPLGVTAYHVRRLADLGLIVLTRQAKRRGSIEHYYSALERR
jgi:DNA-binding transcriptional ArsR family regulator